MRGLHHVEVVVTEEAVGIPIIHTIVGDVITVSSIRAMKRQIAMTLAVQCLAAPQDINATCWKAVQTHAYSNFKAATNVE